LNTSYFIASHLLKGKNSTGFSKPIINIAILGIALGMAVMLLAVAIVSGFKSQIRDKVIGFGSHIQILHYDTRNYLEPNPVKKDSEMFSAILQHPNVSHLQVFANKPGIIKTGEDIEGVMLKGIDTDFKNDFFTERLLEGSFFTVNDTAVTNDVVISKNIADKLNLKLGDNLVMYFFREVTRVRKFRISGIYRTGLEEFDKLYVLADIKHVQRLNDWDPSYVSGFEIHVNDFSLVEQTAEEINEEIGFDLNAVTIRDLNPQIFDWLDLQDINVKIILTLMILVAGINMISTLLIIILEKTRTIGVLKALGMHNGGIREIFLLNASFIIGKGLLWGNIAGLLFCYLQYEYNFIKLDEANYYISSVPIHLEVLDVLLLNLGTLLICLLMMLLPSYIITRILPVKAIRFS
jgi:lipoprotein-releasing system permease protein